MIRSSLHAPVVALAAACTLLVNLGGPALWDDDEPKNAACSLAMLDSGDWIVPTYNGRLRVEKPPLVNWVQAAGFSLCGRNETGARIGSALLTVGSCLLTWGIGRSLFGGDTALVGGLAFATCVWTAIGGRAATPDAPLVFCTTLALWLFVRHGGRTGLSRAGAAAVGAACGLATLAKGPVGLLLPVAALLMFAGWRALSGRAATWRAACAGLRLPTLAGTALLVALPWYVCVAFLTRGAWLEGFLLVHNVGRFATAMEGHSGSLLLYYPCVVAVGLFPWSIVLVAMIAHAAPRLHPRSTDPQSEGVALLACWCLAWIGGFSCSGTKLPGYIWPAYPALALMTALFLVDWARGASLFGIRPRDPDRTRAVVTRVAWGALALGGLAVGVGLPVAAAWRCPGGEWLGLIGLVPVVAAAAAWRFDVARHPELSLATLAVSACLFVSLMAGTATDRFSRAQGMREQVTELAAAADGPWACFWNVPPTVVYYARTTVAKLDTAADVACHLAGHPRARVVVDSRHEPLVRDHLPRGCVVLARIPTLDDRHYLVLGPGPRESASLALVP